MEEVAALLREVALALERMSAQGQGKAVPLEVEGGKPAELHK